MAMNQKFKVQRRKTKTSEWEDSVIELTEAEIYQQNRNAGWDKIRKAQ